MKLEFDHSSRLKRLQKQIARWNVDCVILGGLDQIDSNAYYYSGDLSEPTLTVVSPDFSAFFSTTNGFKQFDETYGVKDLRKNLFAILKRLKAKKIGVDEHSDAARIAFALMKRRFAVKPVAEKLGGLRLVKDAGELKLLKEAQGITGECVDYALACGLAGKTENQVAGLIEYAAREKGCAADAFPPIVAKNEHAAIPHWVPSNSKIAKGDLVLIDCGVRFERYCGDYTRTYYEGQDARVKDAIEAVKESQKAALRKAKAGVKGSVLSKAALAVLKQRGFEKTSHRAIGLSLGHFVGLDVHDCSHRLDDTTLQKGMAFTIEPGVYEKKKFGVRWEDVVLLK